MIFPISRIHYCPKQVWQSFFLSVLFFIFVQRSCAWCSKKETKLVSFRQVGIKHWKGATTSTTATTTTTSRLNALSDEFLENDLVAVVTTNKSSSSSTSSSSSSQQSPRLCVVRPDSTVLPLCQHEDDVENDLFTDPRGLIEDHWKEVTDDNIVGRYGEGWYGQRPVPSLGGGPGYGADADEIWTVDETILEEIANDGVELPILDVGIAHGEKARGGSLF